MVTYIYAVCDECSLIMLAGPDVIRMEEFVCPRCRGDLRVGRPDDMDDPTLVRIGEMALRKPEMRTYSWEDLRILDGTRSQKAVRDKWLRVRRNPRAAGLRAASRVLGGRLLGRPQAALTRNLGVQ